MRKTFALTAILLLTGMATAGEVKGTIKKVDTGKSSLTVIVDGKEQSFVVDKETSFTSVTLSKDKKGKDVETVAPLASGLGGIKEGAKVTLLTDTIENKEVVKSIKVEGGAAETTKKKKKKTT